MTVERINSLLTGRNLQQNQTQEGLPSAINQLGPRGQGRATNTTTPGQKCSLWDRKREAQS